MCRSCSHHLNLAVFVAAFVAVLISSVQPAIAIGISPGRIELDFSPGQNSTHNIYVVGGNYENIAVSSRHYEKCGLSEYIVPEMTKLTLKPGEKAFMKVSMNLPADYPRPGLHECAIVAEEVPQTGYSGVAAFSAVLMQVWIRVPYPEKYLDGTLSVPNVNLSGIAYFTLSLESLGLQDVTAGGVITVTDSDGRVVATLQTGSVFVKSMEKGTLEATWDTKGMPAGRYFATAVVEYGAEKPLSVGSGFKIGDILVRVMNITYPSDIFPDQIVKLEVLVDSYWNDRIDGAYLTMDVKKDGVQVGESRRSESFDLEPWQSVTVPIYWDTDGLSEGAYSAQITVHYSGKTERGIASLEIKQRQNPYLLPLVILAVAAAISAAAFYAYRRRKRKNVQKEGKSVDSGREAYKEETSGKSVRLQSKGRKGKGRGRAGRRRKSRGGKKSRAESSKEAGNEEKAGRSGGAEKEGMNDNGGAAAHDG